MSAGRSPLAATMGRGKILARLAHVHDQGRAEGPRALGLLRATGGAVDGGAGRVGQLDGGRAHPVGGRVHDQRLAGAQAHLVEEPIVGREEDLGDRRGIFQGHPRGDGHGQPLVRHDALGVTAPRRQAEHGIALAKAADTRAGRRNRARKLQAGDLLCGPWLGRRITAPALHRVRTVDGRRRDLDQQVVGAGHRISDLGEPRDLRTAVSTQHDGPQCARLAGSARQPARRSDTPAARPGHPLPSVGDVLCPRPMESGWDPRRACARAPRIAIPGAGGFRAWRAAPPSDRGVPPVRCVPRG